MKTASQIAKEVFAKIEQANTLTRFQLTYNRYRGYKVSRSDTDVARNARENAPESVVGTYDWNATSQMIEADLIYAGCPA
jgi:hypothetical protein